jgi:hypothetical protein
MCHTISSNNTFILCDTKITKYQSSVEKKPGKFSTETHNRWWKITEEASVIGAQTDHQ